MTGVITGFVAYLIAIGYLGWRAAQKTKSESDFILGNRSLSVFVAAFSVGASEMSAWVLLGLPSAVFTDPGSAIWLCLGLSAGVWFSWTWTAGGIRRLSEAMSAETLPTFLGARFSDVGKQFRYVSAVLIVIFFTIYVGAQLAASGKLLTSIFEIDYSLAVVLAALCVLIYAAAGGFLAVCWTDVLQASLMGGAVVLVPTLVFANTDASAASEFGSAFASMIPSGGEGFLGVLAILSALSWGLGYFGQPHLISRFMAVRDPDTILKSRNISWSWQFVVLLGAIGIGLAGRTMYTASDLGDIETLFIQLVQAFTTPWMAGFLLSAVLAAAMSTVDSQLLVVGTALGRDLRKSEDETVEGGQSLTYLRIMVCAVVLLALLMVLAPGGATVFGLVAYAWAGFGAAFGPLMLAVVHRPQIDHRYALASMLAGAIVVVLWRDLINPMLGDYGVYELLPGFTVASIILLISPERRGENPSS